MRVHFDSDDCRPLVDIRHCNHRMIVDSEGNMAMITEKVYNGIRHTLVEEHPPHHFINMIVRKSVPAPPLYEDEQEVSSQHLLYVKDIGGVLPDNIEKGSCEGASPEEWHRLEDVLPCRLRHRKNKHMIIKITNHVYSSHHPCRSIYSVNEMVYWKLKMEQHLRDPPANIYIWFWHDNPCHPDAGVKKFIGFACQ